MAAAQKITLEVPRELLEKALHATGGGISETVRAGRRILAALGAYETLPQSRGKWRAGIAWRELKDDR